MSALLFLPSAAFAVHLRFLPCSLVLAGTAGAMALIVSGRATQPPEFLSRETDGRSLLFAYAVALVILLLGGETHLFFAPWDWLTRDAVLADLVRSGFPVIYDHAGSDLMLRAPLGMYMLPAAIGQVGGLFAAHLALLTQNTLFLGTLLYLLAAIGGTRMHLPVLLLFAGVSAIGGALWVWSGRQDAAYWTRWGLDAWNPIAQYSSTMVQFFWVPNHALPAWWLAFLMLLHARKGLDIATLGVSVAGALMWSPLSVVPVVPWILLSALRSPRAVLLSARTWAGALACAGFLPILVYLTVGSGSIAGGVSAGKPDFAFWYVLFVCVQLPVLAFLALHWRAIGDVDRVLVAVNGCLLLAFPLVRFGPNNDLAMRGSIASLVIVAFVFAGMLVRLTQERARAAVWGWALVLACSPSAIVEIGRALTTPSFTISDCSLIDASIDLNTGVPTNYVAPVQAVPTWLLGTGSVQKNETLERSCWPDRVGPHRHGEP